MLNPSDMGIFIADYNLKTLKMVAKLFSKYSNLNAWTSPEVVTDPKQARHNYYNKPYVDTYSFGMVLFELETG